MDGETFMTAQRQWLSACIWGGYLRSLQRFRNGTSRAAAACFFALALSSVASAQTLSCREQRRYRLLNLIQRRVFVHRGFRRDADHRQHRRFGEQPFKERDPPEQRH